MFVSSSAKFKTVAISSSARLQSMTQLGSLRRRHSFVNFEQDLVSGLTSDTMAIDYAEQDYNNITSSDTSSLLYNCATGATSQDIMLFSEQGPEMVNSTSMASSLLCNTSFVSDADDKEYEYIYDYNDSVTMVPLEELIPVAMVYGLTLVIGAVGNLLVITSIGRFRRMQSVTNVFLVSLASADLLLICACVPIKVSYFLPLPLDRRLQSCV